MEDVLKSIKAFLYDRSASPLLGAFVISSLVWNYRVVILLFSSLPVDEKFASIDVYLTTNILWMTVDHWPIAWKLVNSFLISNGSNSPLLAANNQNHIPVDTP